MEAFFGSSWFLPVWLAFAGLLVPLLVRRSGMNRRPSAYLVLGLLTFMSPVLLTGLVPGVGDWWIVATCWSLAAACVLQSLIEQGVRWDAFGVGFGQRYRLFGMTTAIAGILLLTGFVVSSVAVTGRQLVGLGIVGLVACTIAGVEHRRLWTLLQHIAFGAKKARSEPLRL